jgi:hypothetical protein
MKTASRQTKVLVVAVMASLLFTTDSLAAAFRVDTHLSITAPHHVQSGKGFKISGFLRSRRHFCRASSRIQLVKVGAGVVDKKRTNKRGHYTFHQRIHRTTKFFTRFAGKSRGIHPNIRTCRKSKSRKRTVHAR